MRSHFTRNRAVRAFAALAILGATAGVGAQWAAAGHDTVFELDGNVIDDPGGAPFDWETFFDSNGDRIEPLPSDDFLDSGFDADHAFPDTSTFTGGSKDTLDISGWSCTDSNNLGGKFDILNAYSTIYQDTNGDLLLFFGIERAATEGDGNMGFWFLKDGSVDCEKPVGQKGKAPAFTGNHVDGDIFVVAGFSNGGTEATVTAYMWSGGTNGSLDIDSPFVTGALCTDGTHDACGIVNTGELDTSWASPDKNGGNLDTNAFYEGFVKVPAANVSGCFATFVANTRSSTSPTATIMDFSRGSFPTCAPSTTLSASPTQANPEIAVVGDDVTFSWTETNDGNVPLSDVHVTTDNSDCTTTPESVTLAAGDSQVFSCTITTGETPAIIDVVGTGHGTDSLGRDVTFCAAGTTSSSTVLCDEDEQATARAVTILPGTDLTVTSVSPSTAKTGDEVTFTITEENDGVAPTGYNSELDLTSVTVTASSLDAPAATVTECNEDLGSPTSGDTGDDGVLGFGETWTYQCTVTAPTSSFTLTFNGSATALAGSTHAVTVDVDFDGEEEDDGTVTIINPTTELTITADAVITYTFVEKNDSSNAPLTPPTPGDKTSVLSFETGALCDESDPVFVSSDGNDDDILDPQESWTFTCEGTLDGPTGDTGETSSTLTGVGHGTDTTGDDVTYPNDEQERDRVTVTIENHPRGSDPAP